MNFSLKCLLNSLLLSHVAIRGLPDISSNLHHPRNPKMYDQSSIDRSRIINNYSQ